MLTNIAHSANVRLQNGVVFRDCRGWCRMLTANIDHQTEEPKVLHRAAERGRGAGRPTRARAAEIKDVILRAAMTEFAERGFHASSIASIAARAEVSRRTVYNQFQTKEQLLEVLAKHTCARLRTLLTEVIESDEPIWDTLYGVGMCFYSNAMGADSRAISRLLVMEAERMPALARQGLSLRQYALEPLVNYLERQALEGVIAVEDHARAAQQFLHLTTSSIDYLFGDNGYTPEEQHQWVTAAVKTFLYGVHTRR